jgi:hypothetical protein
MSKEQVAEDPIDKEKLQKQAEQEVQERFQSSDFFDDFILYTLNNFSHRYFASTPAPKSEQIDALTYRVQQREVPVKEGLTSQNTKIKQGTKEMVKKYSPRDGASLLYEMRVGLEHKDPQKPGVAYLTCIVSWDHPEHGLKQNCFKNEFLYEYSEAIELRNKLAYHLENLCEIF